MTEHKKHSHKSKSANKAGHEGDKVKVIEIKQNKNQPQNQSMWKGLSAVLGLLLIISIFTGGFGGNTKISGAGVITKEEAASKALDFINTNLLQGQSEATLQKVEESSELYQIDISIAGQTYNSYMSKDGRFLFPSGIDIAATQQEVQEQQAQETQAATDFPKKEKPEVEVFVMTHCPYGTQIEKGILPVATLLGDKIDLKVKFVYYAMHGKVELDEQLLQHCIQKEQEDKFIDYLGCFLKEGNTADCLKETGIDEAKVNKCVADTDAEFKVTEQFNDQSTWLNGRFPLYDVDKADNEEYGVRGSPSLVVNGKQVSSGRDSVSLLKTICNGFENMPQECNAEVSSAPPSPGFGFNPGAAVADGGCGV